MKRMKSILAVALFVAAMGIAPVVEASVANEGVSTHLTEKEKEGKKKKKKKKECSKDGEKKGCCSKDKAST